MTIEDIDQVVLLLWLGTMLLFLCLLLLQR